MTKQKITKFLKDWGALIIILIIAIGFVWGMYLLVSIEDKARSVEKEYCGPVIDRGYDPPSSGHKSHTEAQYWLVIRDEDIHVGIRIHVTPACYYRLDLSSRACFTLSAGEMEQYGNTNEYKHLK